VSFRTAFFIFDAAFVVALVAVVLWFVFRSPEREPANIRPFLDDDALEGRRLERVLGWSLIFVMLTAVSLFVYFLAEPFRQASAKDAFLERSIERGATLFANKASPAYDAQFSLLCADCHGVDGTGGSASFVLQPEADKCLKKANQNNPKVPECLPKSVSWSAPNLTLAGLRYTRAQIFQIITYGRPGTPMQPWGVASGKGAKDVQSIDDLVNYIESIKTTPAKAMAQAAQDLEQYRKDAVSNVSTARDALTTAQKALSDGQASTDTSADALQALQNDVTTAQANLDQAIANRDEVQGLSDGAILFRLNCARCHTKGWSYHVTDPTRADLPPLPAQGSGAYGPPLTDGTVLLQFPGEAGLENQINWVTVGVPAFQQYGIRGISSGRMPHFGHALTKAQIKAIVEYERSL
jgi:mono/diheme cytochrome c family protein